MFSEDIKVIFISNMLHAFSLNYLSCQNFGFITSDVDWWLIGGHGYHVNHDVLKTWEEAKTYCNDINADLLALETEEEFNQIKNLVNSSYGNSTVKLIISEHDW